jgi:ribosome biogenesis GTPase A
MEKTAVAFLTDYRSGAIGRVSLETPQSRKLMMQGDLQSMWPENPEVASELTTELTKDEAQ